MSRSWQIQEAKNKFSEVIDQATHGQPQVITHRGVEVAVVLSYDEYRKMVSSQKNLSAFFRDSPLADADLSLSRDTSFPRDNLAL